MSTTFKIKLEEVIGIIVNGTVIDVSAGSVSMGDCYEIHGFDGVYHRLNEKLVYAIIDEESSYMIPMKSVDGFIVQE